MQVLLATTNDAKIKYYGTRLKERGIDLVTLKDLNIDIDVDETGKDPIENAVIKAKAYYDISHLPTIAIDDGLFFENVPEEVQPGTHVRRVNGKRLNDSEMIEHYMGLVNQYGTDGELDGYFLKGVAIVDSEHTYTFDFKSKRYFTNKQSEFLDKGYPLDSIQIVPPFNKFKCELTKEEEEETLGIEKREIFGFILKTIGEIEKSSKKLVKS